MDVLYETQKVLGNGLFRQDDLRVVKHRRRFDPTAPSAVRYRIPGTDAVKAGQQPDWRQPLDVSSLSETVPIREADLS